MELQKQKISNGVKYFILIVLVLLFASSFAFAHVGEPEEQHFDDETTIDGIGMMPEQSPMTRKDIGPFVFGGILVVGLAVFFVWNLIKK